ncbi:MAG: CDP-alcohol phosphatidyltransferase family protein [Lachnospiraceae bacterium]|nr:CDP-alcohol phosphatidyltransferase family protein [Lachnospiraceae bacterium]
MKRMITYTYKYFKNEMPDWKRRKDPILSRVFYRRISFATAAVCANIGISANTVSYVSALVAIIADALFLVNSHITIIIAAILVNIWLIMDCTDGNLARSVKKQPFGEFADGISSYILVGFMCTCMGFSVYQTGGVLFEKGCAWIILIGALASSSDTMMRLIYQKYKATEAEMVKEGKIEEELDKRLSHDNVRSFRVRVEAELGVGGILPIFILLASIFNALDLVVLYCLLYFGFSCVVMSLSYVRKAIKHVNEYEVGRKEKANES